MEPDLDLPRLEREPLEPSLRSIDEIDEWIEQDYPSLFDREAYEEEKKRLSVNVPFRL